MVSRAGIAPAPSGFQNRRSTFELPEEGGPTRVADDVITRNVVTRGIRPVKVKVGIPGRIRKDLKDQIRNIPGTPHKRQCSDRLNYPGFPPGAGFEPAVSDCPAPLPDRS